MIQDDIVPTEAAPEPDVEPVELAEIPPEAPAPEALTAQLAEATRAAEENWEKFLRTHAELENLKRRSEKDVQNAHKFGLERFARELLTVVDSLELGLQAATGETPDVAKLREGMTLTLKQLTSVLEKFNVVAVDPQGEKFNPELHQAMAMQPSNEFPPNTVIKVFQKGYLLHDRLLRPSMVVVAQGG